MRIRILVAVLTLVAAMAVGTVVVVAQDSGFEPNPGDAGSLHPDHPAEDHAANQVVHVACGDGAHTNADLHTEGNARHWRLLTYYWTDPTDATATRLVCGLAHDYGHTDFFPSGAEEEYTKITWDLSTRRFTTGASSSNARGRFTGSRVA